jgi:hypothetical protein
MVTAYNQSAFQKAVIYKLCVLNCNSSGQRVGDCIDIIREHQTKQLKYTSVWCALVSLPPLVYMDEYPVSESAMKFLQWCQNEDRYRNWEFFFYSRSFSTWQIHLNIYYSCERDINYTVIFQVFKGFNYAGFIKKQLRYWCYLCQYSRNERNTEKLSNSFSPSNRGKK